MNQQHLAAAVDAARAGAAELMSRRGNRTVSTKAEKDLVTDADLASQQAIRRRLLDEFSDYAFVGEEESEHEPPESVVRGDMNAPPCWIVDPLDGTVNYVHRLNSFAVSIALYADNKMRLGVIYDPVIDEMFTALDGNGAFCNDQPIRVSGCESIDQSLIACSFPPNVRKDDQEVQRFLRVLEQSQSLRRLGSCALNLCYVASGRLDGYFASSVKAWDAAAGAVIARESGAQLTAYDGGPFDDWNPQFCCSSSLPLQQSLTTMLIAN